MDNNAGGKEPEEEDATTTTTTTTAAVVAQDSSSTTLRQLLTALAAGARAVQGLPTTSTTTTTTSGDDMEDDINDIDNNVNNQFAFESSFPEFSTALAQATGTLMETLTQAFASLNGSNNNSNDNEEENEEDNNNNMILDTETSNSMMQDPLFWEQCADACDLLVEQVEAHLEKSENSSASSTAAANNNMTNTWKQWSAAARQQSHVVSFHLMQQRLVDMAKPQITYHIAPPVPNNDRCAPFIPRVSYTDKKPHGRVPLDLSLQPGHGLETAGFRVNNNNNNNAATMANSRKKLSYLPDDIMAPSHHVPHLYATEIQQFTYQPWQLKKPSTIASSGGIPIVENLAATWIDTPRALQELHDKLMTWSATPASSDDNNNTPILELAMDLEAHSFRSFAGLVCLMQISIRTSDSDEKGSNSRMQNYLIDTLKLHNHMNAAFCNVFANPRVQKVMHGADSDVIWLQRDFGLYIVNLFDTGRAARALALPGGAGYANLLRTFVFHRQEQDKSMIDKSHQLSDWRQRPLPRDMQQYAIQDTHYLLDIAQQLRVQLCNHNLMQQVLDTSRQVCLIRYAGEPFKPSGFYPSIICMLGGSNNNNNKQRHGYSKNVKLEWTPMQQAACQALWDWRDATARRLDESIPYICSNRLLAKLAMAMPTTVHQVQSIVSSSSSSSASAGSGSLSTTTSSSTKNTNITNGILQQGLASEVVQCIQQAIHQFEQDKNNSNNSNEEEDEDEEMQTAPTITAAVAASTNVQSSSSAFFKPSSASKERQRRGMMSPVLGTEALYKQAGWMTPQEQQHKRSLLLRAEEFVNSVGGGGGLLTTTSTSDDDEEAVDEDDYDDDDDDDDDEDNNKPRRLLSIQTCNKNYNTKRLAEHSLELVIDNSGDGDGNVVAALVAAPTAQNRGRTVDGMATVRAAREAASQSPIHHPIATLSAVEQDAKQARQSSAEIRSGLHKGGPIPAVLGLLSSTSAASAASTAAATTQPKHGQASGVEGGGARASASKTAAASTEMEEEEFVIPRSMREIYKISNRNRRNKKAASPTPAERGVTPTSEKEREELAKAEALLKERGFEAAGYLFDNSDSSNTNQQQQQQLQTSASSSPGKRAKTKSGRESEESVPQEATGAAAKEDLDFMRGIGWIGSQQTDESIMAQRYASNSSPTRAESTGTTGGCGGDEASTATRPTSRSEEGSHKDSNRPASSASGYTNYDYSQVGPIGAMQPPSTGATGSSFVASNNPFFSGGASGRSSISPALQGGPLNQNLAKVEGGQPQQQRTSRKASGGSNNATNRGGGGAKQANRKQQERPEKKDGRTHAYRSSKRP